MANATRPTSITCAHCGATANVGSRGPVPTYCSGACRAAVKYKRTLVDGRYEAELAAAREKTRQRREGSALLCPYCAAPMGNPRRKQCGKPECKRAFNAERARAWHRNYTETTGERYGRRYREWERDYLKRRRETLGHWRKLYPKAAALADARRRMLVKQADRGERFAPLDVYERDGWTCGVCRLEVDPGLPWPHPMSTSVDHILPLSRGGTHVLTNVQCAHLSCNSRKSDSLIGDGRGDT